MGHTIRGSKTLCVCVHVSITTSKELWVNTSCATSEGRPVMKGLDVERIITDDSPCDAGHKSALSQPFASAPVNEAVIQNKPGPGQGLIIARGGEDSTSHSC